jgi:hypothetical protein
VDVEVKGSIYTLFTLSDTARNLNYGDSHGCMTMNTELDMCGVKRSIPTLGPTQSHAWRD